MRRMISKLLHSYWRSYWACLPKRFGIIDIKFTTFVLICSSIIKTNSNSTEKVLRAYLFEYTFRLSKKISAGALPKIPGLP